MTSDDRRSGAQGDAEPASAEVPCRCRLGEWRWPGEAPKRRTTHIILVTGALLAGLTMAWLGCDRDAKAYPRQVRGVPPRHTPRDAGDGVLESLNVNPSLFDAASGAKVEIPFATWTFDRVRRVWLVVIPPEQEPLRTQCQRLLFGSAAKSCPQSPGYYESDVDAGESEEPVELRWVATSR